MLKNIVGIILLIIVFRLVLESQKQEEDDKKNDKTEKLQELTKALKVSKTVENAAYQLLDDYNGRLPVHADNWRPVTLISRDEWPAFVHVLQEYGLSYKEMYNRIDKVSNQLFKTGFYKKDFNPIRQALKERTSW